jgi:uncharacterized repeat protein (TIGR03803 family)
MSCTSGCIINSSLRMVVPSAVNQRLGGPFAVSLFLALTSLPSSAQVKFPILRRDSMSRTRLAELCFTCTLVLAAVAAPAQTFTTLHTFSGTDGGNPTYVYLVQGLDGNLYGTTSGGGANGQGTAFRITTAGHLTTIYNFCAVSSCADGASPESDLLLASNGAFYGTASAGGGTNNGLVYKLTAAGVLTPLYSFSGSDGSLPYVALIQATNGKFYGTTSGGGAGNVGTIFEVTSTGTLTSLLSFDGSNGRFPDSRLTQGTNGNLYGVTYYGSNAYELSLSGKYLMSSTVGTQPTGALVQASDGNFYGTTTLGGANSAGSVFKMTPGGKVTTIYSFCAQSGCPDGAQPFSGLIRATDGFLYGTTSQGGAPTNGGTIFRISTAGSLTTLYTFCVISNCPDGKTPNEGLLQATNGTFYGTTYAGGPAGVGTVFSLSTGLGPFVRPLTTSGKVGATVILLGTSLKGSTAVTFNGTAATFKIVSATEIAATVPAGATTGTIKVTPPGGVLSSNATYRVTPQITSLTPTSGPVGTVVTITGISLTQASVVKFGGVKAASFTVNTDTQITATVPTGAVTGKIAVTTAGGTATSSTNFTVTP